jgi:hypothetical protein
MIKIKSYSQVCGCINARLSIAIVRATTLCMRGSRVLVHIMSICAAIPNGRTELAYQTI